MTPNDDITYDLHLDRTLEAPRALVWEAWTDPAQLAGWWGPEQFTIPRCEADVRPGGQLRIDMQGPDGTVYPMNGNFAEVVEPERLVLLTAALDDDGAPMFEIRITVVFTADGGRTHLALDAVVLTQGPEAPQYLAGMEAGWSQSLDKLHRDLTGG